jgi:LysM repeat protein
MFFRTLIVASIVSVVAAGPCVRQYTVQAGDYCDKISASQGVSTYQLAVINQGILNPQCTNLVPNESICLGYQGEDCTTVYTVKKGDTCDAIAAAQNVNTTLIHENNPQILPDCSNIYIGEVLCVASSVIVPPPVGTPPPMPSGATPAVPAPPPSTPAPTPSSSPDSGSGDDGDNDDDDLPYCDEL